MLSFCTLFLELQFWFSLFLSQLVQITLFDSVCSVFQSSNRLVWGEHCACLSIGNWLSALTGWLTVGHVFSARPLPLLGPISIWAATFWRQRQPPPPPPPSSAAARRTFWRRFINQNVYVCPPAAAAPAAPVLHWIAEKERERTANALCSVCVLSSLSSSAAAKVPSSRRRRRLAVSGL